jgi:hypothetical protein
MLNENWNAQAGEPAWNEIVASWIAGFRQSQQGKYLIMCLAMAVDATGYVYAPVVACSDTLSRASELSAQSSNRLVRSLHGMPNVLFVAIAKRSDSDEEVKEEVLVPLERILRAAAQDKPVPGLGHGENAIVMATSRNFDTAEMKQVVGLCKTMSCDSEAGYEGGSATTK